MTKIAGYRQALRERSDWDEFLRANSGLPGPRGNLELAQAAAEEGRAEQFEAWIRFSPQAAPVDSPDQFLVVCGTVGLGRLLAEGERLVLPELRALANDPRWRTREAVAMALQRWGDANLQGLLEEMRTWSQGSLLEQRAAAAALCEPRLLRNPEIVLAVFDILDTITTRLGESQERKTEPFKALRKGLAYCWSVAVAALPAPGFQRLQQWCASPDADVRWVMRENLKKNRLLRLDAAWVRQASEWLNASTR